MNLFKLTWKNLWSRPLATLLSLILIMLGVGLITFVLQVKRDFEGHMGKNIKGIDMVVGAKGSPLQLILSAVFHIDAPTGNIKLIEAEKLKKNRLVKYAIPLSYGDSYNGYRIVGTDTAFSKLYNARLKTGVLRKETFEVNLGAGVATDLNLKIGDEFSGSHGLVAGGATHDDQNYRVTGIFEASNTVLDQLILTNLESVWDAHNHGAQEAHEDIENDPDHQLADLEITALLVKFRSPMGVIQLPRWVNTQTNMQAAVPSYELKRLTNLMGFGIDTINGVAVIIMIVAGISVFISLLNSLKERQPELALMRSYGASRKQLAATVLLEGLLTSLLGFAGGIALSKTGFFVTVSFFPQSLSLPSSALSLSLSDAYLLLVVVTISFLSALIPVIKSLNINISKTLATS
ncbi:ABC transporter permease [Fulvivirgaceae bacterium BMA12]|uniref:ABC transporter permease n=1 Tax=Agaribacillus aureus TaxID=3051825 RepID=A0ABT8LFT2_9BACT|nr:ABC transporter permease [Fulvivirgaceae bacterium BMA12]